MYKRQILKNAPVLILDEATSALDAESESLVQAALANLMAERTVIVIAHRLSTVRRATRIVVLESGRITDVGSHEELLQTSATYQKLYRLQFMDIGENGNHAGHSGIAASHAALLPEESELPAASEPAFTGKTQR